MYVMSSVVEVKINVAEPNSFTNMYSSWVFIYLLTMQVVIVVDSFWFYPQRQEISWVADGKLIGVCQ